MKKQAAQGNASHFLQVICILLLLALLSFILINEGRRNAEAVGLEKAGQTAFTYTDALDAYVFRDEAVLHSTNNGPVDYLEADGTRVQAGAPLVQVYVDDTGTDKRVEAAAIYAEIARLERALERDVIPWQETYTNAYGAMMQAIGTDDWSSGLSNAQSLAAVLESRSVLTGDEVAVRARIDALRLQAADLVRYVDAPQVLVADEVGCFCHETDGYEALFGLSAVDALTPESLMLLLDAKLPSNDTVGKLISTDAFYLAVPVSTDVAARYTVGATYRVHMEKGCTATMTLTRVASGAAGNALLILGAGRMPYGMDLTRHQSVTIERETVKGISVPVSAVYTEPEGEVVYVVKNGVAEKRRLRVLCRTGGSCIVAADGGEGYLQEGESIVLSSRSIYEGKVLRK
ncbi:MAG: hypothetical protein IJY50_04255 [Clostridia bacterium]|nr:hypothetical protein [Clostridia bacterium]